VGAAECQGRLIHFQAKCTAGYVDGDQVIILHESNRPTHESLRCDMPDAGTLGGTREAPIGDQCDRLTQTHPDNG